MYKWLSTHQWKSKTKFFRDMIKEDDVAKKSTVIPHWNFDGFFGWYKLDVLSAAAQ